MNYINGRLVTGGSINDIQYQIDVLNRIKQDLLESGVNIKTINGQSIIGEGDLEVTSAVGTSEDIISSITLGGIAEGDLFEAGTSIETIIKKLLSISPLSEIAIEDNYFAFKKGMDWGLFLDSKYSKTLEEFETEVIDQETTYILYNDKLVVNRIQENDIIINIPVTLTDEIEAEHNYYLVDRNIANNE